MARGKENPRRRREKDDDPKGQRRKKNVSICQPCRVRGQCLHNGSPRGESNQGQIEEKDLIRVRSPSLSLEQVLEAIRGNPPETELERMRVGTVRRRKRGKRLVL